MRKTKRLAAAVLGCAMLFGLTGCFGGAASSTPQPTATPNATPAHADAVRTGLGVTAHAKGGTRSGKVTITAAGVLLDSGGRILRCVVDEAECELTANDAGVLALPGGYRTKYEMKEEYGLKKASDIGREWYQQIDAFCKAAEGRTAEQLSALAEEDGEAADMLSGCTIDVGGYVEALQKACRTAAVLGAAENDSLALGTVLKAGGIDAAFDKPGTAQVTATMALLSKDSAGAVTSAVLDEIQPELEVANNGGMTVPGKVIQTKVEQAEAYGMKEMSAIGLEWYQQAANFAKGLKGRTLSQIQSIPSNGTDVDLAAGCTIAWTEFLEAAAKAAA